MGFKFYSDSIRFIVVLAGIAGLGFLASAVQFIKLGVSLAVVPSARNSPFFRSNSMSS